MNQLRRFLSGLGNLASFVRYALRRFISDGCLTGAGALSYTSLVALVPVPAIAIPVLSAFPVFADTRDQLLAALFRAFVPQVGEEVEWWFRYFAGTSARTTTIGVLALAVTVVLLLATASQNLYPGDQIHFQINAVPDRLLVSSGQPIATLVIPAGKNVSADLALVELLGTYVPREMLRRQMLPNFAGRVQPQQKTFPSLPEMRRMLVGNGTYVMTAFAERTSISIPSAFR